MTSVQEALILAETKAFEFLVSFNQLRQAIRIQCTDRLIQVSVHLNVAKVELLTGIIGKDPRKHRILCDIIECATGHLVELHQVLKV